MPEAVLVRARAVLAAALVVIIAAGTMAILVFVHDPKGSSSEPGTAASGDQRQQVIGAAGQLAVDFTSIDYHHLQADFTATSKHATTDFAKKYLATVKAFEPLYRKGKVVQTTSVEAAGIQSLTGDTAVVLVALKGVSTNTQAPNGSEQLFRMQVDLAKVGDSWLASNVQPI